MKFYTVSDAYITYLKRIEAKVPDNYGGKRPYVGIILEIGGHQYLAPLTSHKPKHDQIKTSSSTVFKIHEKGDPTNKLGMLQLNNMIPVLASEVTVVDFSTQDPKYRAMMRKQLDFITSNQEDVKAKAEKLYELVMVTKNDWACKMSCDFLSLEASYKLYGQPIAVDLATTEEA